MTSQSLTIVTGSFPPDKCGVGDYTAQLLQALRRAEATVDCYAERDWSLAQLFAHWRRLRRDSSLLLMQHPTAGFDKRLAPFLLWLLLPRRRKAVTLHEFSRKGRLGKLLCYIFFLCSFRIIFTNRQECQAAQRYAPWIHDRTTVIPIGSNIPFVPRRPVTIDLAYFGLILPDKGIEIFLEILERLPADAARRTRFIGQVSKGSEAFAADVFSRLERCGVERILNASPRTVAEALASTAVVLLPFPDGISSRRGSALAAMGNGALVVASTARAEIEVFRERCLMADTVDGLATLCCSALNDPERYTGVRRAGAEYARSFDWDRIAADHLRFLSG